VTVSLPARCRAFGIVFALGLLLPACEELQEPRACTAVAIDALTVTVVDAATGRRLCDATVTVIDGSFTEDLRAFGTSPSDCSYSGATERAGRYEVRASRSGYAPAVARDVRVDADECHVIPVMLSLSLVPSVQDGGGTAR
jgi:hypothetical protein